MRKKIMPYRNCKVYSDGSHFIAIPHTTRPKRKAKSLENISGGNTENVEENIAKTKQSQSPKDLFEEAYKESAKLPKKQRKKFIQNQLEPYFENPQSAQDFVDVNIERKRTNSISRKVRLMRKVNLQDWNYFCTFTYDSALHTEETFRKKLSNCFKHLSSRKGWKYIGVWERSPTKQRLHFHGIFYIPENSMIGTLEKVRDFSTKNRKMQFSYINSHFKSLFGRNDFKPLCTKQDAYLSVGYIVKYLEKSGEKLVYSRGLPTYFKSDIMDDDVACRIGVEDKKLLLFDNFTCVADGEIIGEVSPQTISQMPKAN